MAVCWPRAPPQKTSFWLSWTMDGAAASGSWNKTWEYWGESNFQRTDREFGYLLVWLPHFTEGRKLRKFSLREEDILALSSFHFPMLPSLAALGNHKWRLELGRCWHSAGWAQAHWWLRVRETLVLGGQRLSLFAQSPDTPALPVPLQLYFVLREHWIVSSNPSESAAFFRRSV